MSSITLDGEDNYGQPRQNFADKIGAMNEADFLDEMERVIWLSAYASNKPRADYHWQAEACYDDAVRRGKPELYERAWNRAARSAS